jgi:ABC-type antimicrobial peptide transport system permease subunit
VVGVAEDVHRQGYREPASIQVYVPLGTEEGISGLSLVVRPSTDPGRVQETLRTVLAEVNPIVDYVDIRRLDDLLDPQVRPWRLGAVVITLTAIAAMLLSLIGVYGVQSYLVAQRRHEIGVRMALGASAPSVRGLVLRTGLTAGGLGVLSGVALVIGLSRWIAPLLFETSVSDPLVLSTVAALLVGAAAASCVIPASQAAKVDPVFCLRAER